MAKKKSSGSVGRRASAFMAAQHAHSTAQAARMIAEADSFEGRAGLLRAQAEELLASVAYERAEKVYYSGRMRRRVGRR